jgi:dimeric dUTPase (all-alpha-NTP-PPase superfamily)
MKRAVPKIDERIINKCKLKRSRVVKQKILKTFEEFHFLAEITTINTIWYWCKNRNKSSGAMANIYNLSSYSEGRDQRITIQDQPGKKIIKTLFHKTSQA